MAVGQRLCEDYGLVSRQAMVQIVQVQSHTFQTWNKMYWSSSKAWLKLKRPPPPPPLDTKWGPILKIIELQNYRITSVNLCIESDQVKKPGPAPASATVLLRRRPVLWGLLRVAATHLEETWGKCLGVSCLSPALLVQFRCQIWQLRPFSTHKKVRWWMELNLGPLSHELTALTARPQQRS